VADFYPEKKKKKKAKRMGGGRPIILGLGGIGWGVQDSPPASPCPGMAGNLWGAIKLRVMTVF